MGRVRDRGSYRGRVGYRGRVTLHCTKKGIEVPGRDKVAGRDVERMSPCSPRALHHGPGEG